MTELVTEGVDAVKNGTCGWVVEREERDIVEIVVRSGGREECLKNTLWIAFIC